MEYEPLLQGNYYHINNRGNNGSKLFSKPEEYEHFLQLYDKYILPIADTFAWALMGNHFHLLVHIKSHVVYKYSLHELENMKLSSYATMERKWETMELDSDRAMLLASSNTLDNHKIPVPYKHFAHLFNAYSRYLQTRNGRTGNLFERPFKRKLIDSEDYLKTVVLYIHNNSVHHGFCKHTLEYPWTSYLNTISEKPTKLKRDEVIKLFNDKENFKQQHNNEIDIVPIEKWLEIAPYNLHDLVDADRACPDLSGSMDAVRSEEVAAVDLSACAAPDNVLKNANLDTDRACPDLSGSMDTVRSGKNNI